MNGYFDNIVNRRNTNSLKWDVKDTELPMWVADMDFQTAPEIRAALRKRVEHGVFGYSTIPLIWYSTYVDWWKEQHHFLIEKDWLIFTTGVVPAISSIVRKLTKTAEKVLIQTPVYNIFYNSILNNGRQVLESPLQYVDGQYQIDFVDLEKKLSDPQTSLMILCNPHNPVGKIWDKETLNRIGELCFQYHVKVISDEIHCDLTEPGKNYIPFASVSQKCREISITCVAPTKCFNLAGLQTAAVFVPNADIRHKVWRGLNTDEVAEPNVFAVDAAIAAFSKGKAWLEELKTYIFDNRKVAETYIKNEIPEIKVVLAEATYLMWIDCSPISKNALEIVDFIRENTGLFISEGSQYGKTGENFVRINIACSRDVLQDGLKRLKQGICLYKHIKEKE